MKCFTCQKCCTNNCPNIQYDMAGDFADDIGLKRVNVKIALIILENVKIVWRIIIPNYVIKKNNA